MGEHTSFSCDVCGKDVVPALCHGVVVHSVQAPRTDFYDLDWKDWPYKYKQEVRMLVCEDCIGSEVTRCYGDTPAYWVADLFKSLLRKLGVLRAEPGKVSGD